MGRRHRLASIFAALSVVLLALPAFAQASGQDVIRDCYDDGHIDGNYSPSEYQDAQDNLPSDVDQYSDCRDVIAQGQAGGSKGSKGTKGNGSNGSNGGATGGGSNTGGGSGTTNTAGHDASRGGSPKPYEGDPALQTKSGAYAPSQNDKAAYDAAKAQAARGGALPGGLAIPAAGEFQPGGNSLPLPVVLALAAVALLVAATTVLVARRRLPALQRVVPRRFRSS
jgi:hypothetical protein